MGKELNVRTFEDTKKLLETNAQLKKSVKDSIAGQKVIRSGEELSVPDLRIYETPAKVTVSDKRMLEAVRLYQDDHVAVLCSTWDRPCGRIIEGEDGLQESLGRCTTLKPCLDDCVGSFYPADHVMETPLFNDDIIFTPGVTVFKEDGYEPSLMRDTGWQDIDVISCIPPDTAATSRSDRYRKPVDFLAFSEVRFSHLCGKRIRRVLDVAAANKCDTVILCAMGCGGAKNPADTVARAMLGVVKDYLYAFRNIEFAVYDRSCGGTYKCFKDTIENGLLSEDQKI